MPPAVLVVAAVLRLGVIVNHRLDPDESQHLHVAWLVSTGLVPYRDFWEHHVPLFHYLMAPLTAAFLDRPVVYFAARAAMAACAAITVALTWRLGNRLGAGVGAWAAAALVALPQFTLNSTETRPDVLALVAHVASLGALVRWREAGRPRWAAAAGLLQGLALALSLKAAFAIAGVGVTLLLAAPARPGAGRVRGALAFAAALAVVPAAVIGRLATEAGAAGLRAMADHVLGQTVRFVDFGKTRPLFGSELGTLAVAAVGVVFVLRIRGRGVLRHPVHGALLPATLVLTLLLELPRTPAVYQQAWLPLLPVLAIYAGLGLAALLRWAETPGGGGRRALAGAALALALLPPGLESAWSALRDETAGQLQVMRAELAGACPGEPVLDGTGLYVFRPHAYRYGVLVTGVREWVARGMVAEETLEADMRAARAPVAYPDRRLRAMIGPVATFLETHYLPWPDGLLVAGVHAAAGPPGGRLYVELLRSGLHEVVVTPGTQAFLDQAPLVPGWRRLDAGRHELTWAGPGGAIRIRALTCAERGGPRA